jgi:hypothetical protein
MLLVLGYLTVINLDPAAAVPNSQKSRTAGQQQSAAVNKQQAAVVDQTIANNTPPQPWEIRPILNHPAKPTRLPLLDVVFETDPLVRGWIESEKEALAVRSKVDGLIKKLPAMPAQNKLAAMEEIYIHATRLTSYYAKALNDTDGTDSQKRALFKKYATINVGHAESFADEAPAGKKGNALYQAAITRIMLDQNTLADEANKLLAIKNDLAPKLQKNVELLVAIAFTDSSYTINEGRSTLIREYPTVSGLKSVVIGLCAAKSLVGASLTSEIPGVKADPAFKTYLDAALAKGATLPAKAKEEVAAFAIWVWETAQGSQPDYAKFNIALNRYENTLAAAYAIENMIHARYLGKDGNGMIKEYAKMRVNAGSAVFKYRIDAQIFALEHNLYLQTKNFIRYHRFLQGLLAAYDKPVSGVSQQKSFVSRIKREQFSFVADLLHQASAPGYNAANRQEVLKIGVVYTASAPVTPQIRLTLLESIAKTYQAASDLQKASGVFSQLVKENPIKYLEAAIDNQSKLTGWPAKADWSLAVAAKPNPQLTPLIQYYNLLIKITAKSPSWPAYEQAAILKINQNQKVAAFKDLRTAITLMPGSPSAQIAAGFMLGSHFALKEWPPFIQMAHLVQKQKITPLMKGTPYPLEPAMAAALLAQGKISAAAQNHKDALANLNELVIKYPKAKEHEEGTGLYARTLYAARQVPLAIKILYQYTVLYPQSRTIEASLLEGVNWATAAKSGEYINKFYLQYLTLLPHSPKTPGIRSILATRYIVDKSYSEALGMYKAQIADPKAPLKDKIAAAIGYMQVNEKYGDLTNGAWAADRLIELAGKDEGLTAISLGYYAKIAAKAKDYKKLGDLERRLAGMNPGRKEVNESLGFVRYHTVKNSTPYVVNTENPKMIKDPKSLVTKFFNQFLEIKKKFDTICPTEPHGYCVAAKIELIVHARKAREAIAPLFVAATYSEQDVKAFELFKQQYLSQLAGVENSCISSAKSLIDKGIASQEWRQKLKDLEFAH